MIPLVLEGVLDVVGIDVGLWLTLLLAALYSRKVLKIGSVAGQGVRYGAVAIAAIGLGMALGVVSLDVGAILGLGGDALDLLVGVGGDVVGGLV